MIPKLQIYSAIWFKTLLKLAAFFALLYFLFRMFQTKTSQQEWFSIINNFGVKEIGGCLLVIAFMPLNWAFEAKKWQLLLTKIHKTNFVNSYKSVIWGATLGNLSPFMIGDFVGRLRGIPNRMKTKAGMGLLLGNGMQMFVLLIFARFGYDTLYYASEISLSAPNQLIRHVLMALLVLGILVFTKAVKIPKYTKNSRFQIMNILDEYSKSTIGILFVWAILRHVIFTFQFVILLWVFKVDLSVTILVSLVSIIFLFKTLGATLGMFGDMLSRQLSAAYFFGLYAVSIEPVLAATTLLWIINIFVPMFIGSFLIFSRKTANLNEA
ncbi:MAG: flippase-like domain-containing protein [Spirosomaceae bacterium]|nr:flippase-like domain-containing protein [Spirosomataceae bacterium]